MGEQHDVVQPEQFGGHVGLVDEDIQPLALTEQEIDDLVAFLASLTSAQYSEFGAKELARQRQLAFTKRPHPTPTRESIRVGEPA